MSWNERPEFGWHTRHWGLVRRWWERRRTPDLDPAEPVGEYAPEEPEEPEDAAPRHPRRWWVRILVCAGAVLLLAAVRPAPAWWLVCGAGGAVLVVRGTVADRAERLAYALQREQTVRTARAIRTAQKRVNREAWRIEREQRYAAAAAARAKRRQANRDAHRRGSRS